MINDQASGFKVCEDYSGENYCAPESYRIHFMAMKCTGEEQEIMQCYRELAEDCNHT